MIQQIKDEIVYLKENRQDRSIMHGYHQSPSPREMHKGAKSYDVQGLKKRDLDNLLTINGDYTSKFTIGIEIEKNRFYRRIYEELNLIKGYETDGSCGYEAITNILPLLPPSNWRNKIFNMFHEAKYIIEDRYSPSNHKCGGHITIRVDGMSSTELHQRLRKHVGVLYAMFQKRFKNGYCNWNMRMLETEPSFNRWNPASQKDGVDYRGDFHGKYQVCLDKGHGLVEFRLPSRFTSVKQTMRRYELFYVLMDVAVNKPNTSHDALLKRCKPILMSMYEKDEVKVDYVLAQAKHWKNFIMRGKMDDTIKPFCSNYIQTIERYENNLRRR